MSEAKTFFKWGCLGCLGILGLILLVTFGTLGVVWRDVKQEVPQAEVARIEPAEIAAATQADGVIRLVLDVGYVDVTIDPVDADREFRIEAKYDERSHVFEQTRTTSPADGSTTWNIEFRKTSRLPFAGLRTLFGGIRSTIVVEVPLGVRFSIEGEVHDGALQGDLGGTGIRVFDIDLHRGAVVMAVDRPVTEPMQRFAVRASQAANVISGLGNASPREVDVDCSMGACVIDLNGEWRNDAAISLAASMSAGVLAMSEDVAHEGLEDVKGFDRLEAPPLMNADAEVPLPTLRFTVDGKWELQ